MGVAAPAVASQPAVQAAVAPQVDRGDDVETLKEQAQSLQVMLDAINDRIRKLDAPPAEDAR